MCVLEGCIGYIILLAAPRSLPGLSYAAIYLAACGIYPLIPNTVTWASGSFEGSYKRGFGQSTPSTLDCPRPG